MLNNLLLLAYKCNHYYHGCLVDKQRMDWLPSQTLMHSCIFYHVMMVNNMMKDVVFCQLFIFQASFFCLLPGYEVFVHIKLGYQIVLVMLLCIR
jgi:hypothetical protein